MRIAPVRVAIAASIAACAWPLLACGGGHRHGGAVTPGIHGVTPDHFSAANPTPLTITGAGFGAGGSAVVRLTAAAGTPFAAGTAAFADVAGTVASDTAITLTSPLAEMCSSASTGISFHVTLPDSTEYDSGGPIATLERPTVVAMDPSVVPAATPTPFTLFGTGFGPVSGAASVTFTAASGTPFGGGTSATATVAGFVASETSITGTTPPATTAVDVSARVDLLFAGGSCAASAPGIVVFSVSRPPVLSTSVSGELVLSQGDRVSFTVTATDPDGDAVSIRLLNPPAGCTFAPVVNAPSPKSATVEWVVDPGDDPGPQALLFRANDSAIPSVKTTLAVWVHVTPLAVRTLRVGDVTGDGIPDVVVSARNADAGGVVNSGAIYVWAGATTPSGTPTATLTVPGAIAGDMLANGGFRLVDVTGDGVLDVVAATDQADVSGLANAGAIYVWKGGPGLSGPKAPDATLTAVAAGANSGLAARPLLWQAGDVTGDGTADIVACAPLADAGPTDAGALYLWKGGAGLVGAKSPDATLVMAGPAANDQLGRDGLQLADLSGDGILDVFSAAPNADPGGIVDAGALCVWKGSATLTGTKTPDAVLTATGSSAGDGLGAGSGSGIRLVDVTGDGVRDVVASVPSARPGGVAGAGAIYVWKGGASLSGSRTEDASLTVSGAVAGDGMGSGPATRLLVGDLSGDGIPDVLGVAANADVSGVVDAGALYLWKGGAGMTGAKSPDATLSVPGAAAGDTLGSGGTRLADVTNDGVLDVVSAAPFADAGGIANAGAVYVWAGGAGLAGPKPPSATLAVAGAAAEDRLAIDPSGRNFTPRFGDVTGDGALDVVVPAAEADVGGAFDAGALYLWKGGAALSGSPSPLATMTVPGASSGDRLGSSSGASVALGDVTGDGVFDVVSAAAAADAGGVVNSGAIYAWKGGASLSGAVPPDATLRVAGSHADDQLAGGIPDGVAWDLRDVTADGTRDVVAVACLADTATLSNSGAGYLWAGGAGLLGTLSPTATLLAPGAANADLLGRTGTTDLLVLGDVTGDGFADILVGAPDYTGSGAASQGGIFLWRGGALSGTPAPTATLLAPGASSLDRLGN